MVREAVRVRAARPDEAAALSALALRSKAHWGYDEEFLAARAPELAIRAEEVGSRRVVVAEASGAYPELLGVATLEGRPPVAELGLLFVEPSAIGRGVGRRLYRDAVRRARELGCRALVIGADPHAAGFYRAMGARPAGGAPVAGLVRFEVRLGRAAPWVALWSGDRPAVHLGNVAEYNAQFGDASLDREQLAAHHYAALAAFYGPRPGALVLPRPVPAWWVAQVARQLDWSRVAVHDGVAPDRRSLSAAVAARHALAARLTGSGAVLVPWGQSPDFARLAGGGPWRPEVLRHESKAASHALFTGIVRAGGHPDVLVPRQWRPRNRWAAARLVAARTRAGLATVLKSEHGVGGSGTRVLTPERVRAAGGALAALRGLPRGPLLAEEYAHDPDAPVRDLTYDAFVDAAGRVHPVGAAVMDVVGTAYHGATVGPGVVPDGAREVLSAFGGAVGRELAAAGYRGWFDVDFVGAGQGRLAPTETNLRLTGPSAAFVVKARLDELRGGDHVVRIMDRVELGARLPEAMAGELCAALARGCAELGAVFVPAIPTAAFDPAPWLGVLVAAHTREAVDAAEALVRARAAAVGAMFGEAAQDPAAPSERGRRVAWRATIPAAIISGTLKA
ncbi:GNAT family N-acetyltransferase [Streptomyces sp. NPDC059917]|uniref:GNAT family N-acetyltransferase n=1 Tax=Streptomyces sp. NPDC059917 TaxID=3347002 RepID=UPI003660F686